MSRPYTETREVQLGITINTTPAKVWQAWERTQQPGVTEIIPQDGHKALLKVVIQGKETKTERRLLEIRPYEYALIEGKNKTHRFLAEHRFETLANQKTRWSIHLYGSFSSEPAENNQSMERKVKSYLLTYMRQVKQVAEKNSTKT